jgi:NAD(P)-dependent dehydrogenase (short-subunit alcohol dehydrogenase family)
MQARSRTPTRGLAGKVVVITGASSGFGRGTALALARKRAKLVLAARRGELIDDLAQECRAAGGQAFAYATDVSLEREVEALARNALRSCGRIDVWINNAGVGALGPFERIPLADHEQVIRTDLLGTLYASYFAYQHFRERGEGTLINIASELGRRTVPYYSSYTAAKHGVVGLSDALRQEIELERLEDIHVCTVLPTAHDAALFDRAAPHTGHPVEAPRLRHDPRDVVEAIVGLVLDPRDKQIVGSDGIAKIPLKRVAPGAAESPAARQEPAP